MLERTSSLQRTNERLRQRRRRNRRRLIIAAFAFLIILIAAALYGMRQSGFRISNIEIYGADQSYAQYAETAMQGFYWGIIPRNSIFFIPEGAIRSAILAEHPEIAAVSLFANGLTGLTVSIDERTPVAQWCGASVDASSTAQCYLFDVNGYVFSPAASTTETLNPFKVYEPLATTSLPQTIGATLPNSDSLPSAFDFARQIETLGSPVESVAINGTEVDDYLESGTRIIYVLGDEQNAFTELVSAKDLYDLADGSIEYVDLRFDGKIYLKKKE